MARVRTSSRIRGLPRDKKSRILKLQEDIRKKGHILRIEAPLGIVGLPGSGRKTLAYRFANMNQGVLDEVPAAYFYTPFWEGRFPLQFPNPYGRFSLKLYVYIVPEPEELPPCVPPLYLEHWNDFCCLLFAFDVRNLTTFHAVSLQLTAYRRNNFRVPTCFIVGNKSDRRLEPPPLDPQSNERDQPEQTPYMEAEHLGATYFECSAKNNTDVSPLLAQIKCCATDRRYWLPEN